jgi:hypothetical protein
MDHELDAGRLLWAMERGSNPRVLGSSRSVVKLTFRERPARWRHYWFVANKGAAQLCITDPDGDVDLHLITTLRDIIYVWRGDLPLQTALRENRVEAIGSAKARSALPLWLAKSKLAGVRAKRAETPLAQTGRSA